ncbi:MAG: NADH-quinone oxidoreductase subunit [Chloroflexota bacterium]|jgi:(2Fe-2S) ferredoxin|nr:NADH-quinone oxidoreductase subunit [Chloroflexota bacterium]
MARSNEIASVIVCTNVDCAYRGAQKNIEGIQQRLEAAGSDVKIKTYLCFGGCEDGPNLVLYPEGTWYAGVKEEDLDDIVGHVLGGPKVERLTERVDPGLQELILDILDSGMIDL